MTAIQNPFQYRENASKLLDFLVKKAKQNNSNQVMITQKQIGNALNISDKTVRRSLGDLKKGGYIESLKTTWQNKNLYTILADISDVDIKNPIEKPSAIERVRELRAKGWTQRKIAFETGYSQPTVSKWLKDLKNTEALENDEHSCIDGKNGLLSEKESPFSNFEIIDNKAIPEKEPDPPPILEPALINQEYINSIKEYVYNDAFLTESEIKVYFKLLNQIQADWKLKKLRHTRIKLITIAEKLKINEKTVRIAIKTLIEKGFINQIKPKGSRIKGYTFNTQPTPSQHPANTQPDTLTDKGKEADIDQPINKSNSSPKGEEKKELTNKDNINSYIEQTPCQVKESKLVFLYKKFGIKSLSHKAINNVEAVLSKYGKGEEELIRAIELYLSKQKDIQKVNGYVATVLSVYESIDDIMLDYLTFVQKEEKKANRVDHNVIKQSEPNKYSLIIELMALRRDYPFEHLENLLEKQSDLKESFEKLYSKSEKELEQYKQYIINEKEIEKEMNNTKSIEDSSKNKKTKKKVGKSLESRANEIYKAMTAEQISEYRIKLSIKENHSESMAKMAIICDIMSGLGNNENE